MTRKYIPKITHRGDLIRPDMISDEMSNCGWFTLDEAVNILEPRKRDLLIKANEWIVMRTNSNGLVSCRVISSPRRKRYGGNRGFSNPPQNNRNFKNVRDEYMLD